MSPGIYLLTISLPLVTAAAIFAMKYAASYAAARAQLEQQRSLQALSERTIALQSETDGRLRSMESELSRLSRSLAAVETMLKQVG